MSWLRDYVDRGAHIPPAESDADLSELLGSGFQPMATDSDGRLYLRLPSLTRYVRVHTGIGGVTQQKVARDLINLGFEKIRIRVRSAEDDDESSQMRAWRSQPRFLSDIDEE